MFLARQQAMAGVLASIGGLPSVDLASAKERTAAIWKRGAATRADRAATRPASMIVVGERSDGRVVVQVSFNAIDLKSEVRMSASSEARNPFLRSSHTSHHLDHLAVRLHVHERVIATVQSLEKYISYDRQLARAMLEYPGLGPKSADLHSVSVPWTVPIMATKRLLTSQNWLCRGRC